MIDTLVTYLEPETNYRSTPIPSEIMERVIRFCEPKGYTPMFVYRLSGDTRSTWGIAYSCYVGKNYQEWRQYLP